MPPLHSRCPLLLLALLLGAPVQATATAETGKRTVYRCLIDGVTVLADRPCDRPGGRSGDDQATVRELSVRTAPPTAVPSRRPVPEQQAAVNRPPTSGNVPGRAADTPAKAREVQCAELRKRLDAHAQRMRAGYRASEAGRLWDRERTLKGDWRAAGC